MNQVDLKINESASILNLTIKIPNFNYINKWPVNLKLTQSVKPSQLKNSNKHFSQLIYQNNFVNYLY